MFLAARRRPGRGGAQVPKGRGRSLGKLLRLSELSKHLCCAGGAHGLARPPGGVGGTRRSARGRSSSGFRWRCRHGRRCRPNRLGLDHFGQHRAKAGLCHHLGKARHRGLHVYRRRWRRLRRRRIGCHLGSQAHRRLGLPTTRRHLLQRCQRDWSGRLAVAAAKLGEIERRHLGLNGLNALGL